MVVAILVTVCGRYGLWPSLWNPFRNILSITLSPFKCPLHELSQVNLIAYWSF